MLLVGTDCSGIEAPIQALKNLNIPFTHVFSSDIDKYCIQSIKANYHPEKIYGNITERDNTTLGGIDMYVCGFPCQPFSTAGKKLGSNDTRANIMDVCIDVINTKLPKIFVLENVKGFKTIEKGKNYNYLLEELTKSGLYSVYTDVLNTKNYGLPQNRERLFFIGIRKDVKTGEYATPEHKPMKSLEDIIIDKIVRCNDIPKTLEYVIKKKSRVLSRHAKFHIMSSGQFGTIMCDISPTVTCKHKHYIYENKRYMTAEEALGLQGFFNFNMVVSETQAYKQAGNSMSICVLEALFCQIFDITRL